jgi:hypothetical protein
MFQIRPAGTDPHDADTIVAIFDSTIPALAANGNEGQWGTQLFSAKDGFIEETREGLAKSEKFRLKGEGERVRTFIAQVEDASNAANADGLHRSTSEHGRSYLPVGAITIRDSHFASHLYTQHTLQPHIKDAENATEGFVYIDVLVSDYRVPGEKRRGAGAALIDAAKQYARERKMRSVFVDCWTSGQGKLVP